MLGENSKVICLCASVAIQVQKHLERGLDRTGARASMGKGEEGGSWLFQTIPPGGLGGPGWLSQWSVEHAVLISRS